MNAIKIGRSTLGGWNSFVSKSYVVQTQWFATLTDGWHGFPQSKEQRTRTIYKMTQLQLPSTTLQLTTL
jgi:hypothetical protein